MKNALMMFICLAIMLACCIDFDPPEFDNQEELLPERKVLEVEYIPVKTYYDVPLGTYEQDYLMECCKARDLEVELMLAIFEVESNFRPEADNGQNCYGLGQIHGSNYDWLHREIGLTDFFSPIDNINGSTFIMRYNLDNYGTIEKALMAYNMAPAGRAKLWKQGIYTTPYVEKVLALKKTYKKRMPAEA